MLENVTRTFKQMTDANNRIYVGGFWTGFGFAMWPVVFFTSYVNVSSQNKDRLIWMFVVLFSVLGKYIEAGRGSDKDSKNFMVFSIVLCSIFLLIGLICFFIAWWKIAKS